MRSREPPGDGRPRPARRAATPAAAILPTRDYPELLQRLPAIIYIADVGRYGRWHYISPQVKTILGFSAEEWCANPRLWFDRIHPDDRQWVLADEERSIAEGIDGASEYRLVHRDGYTVWIRDDARLVRDRDGNLRWHGVLSNVTERKHVECELERRAAQQAAVAQLGEHALEGATVEELMREAVSAAARLLGVEMATIAERLPDGQQLELRAGYGGLEQVAAGRLRFPVHAQTQVGYALLTGRPAAVSDWSIERRFERSELQARLGVASGVWAVIVGSRAPFGALGAFSAVPRDYGAADLDFLQSLANVLADAIDRRSIEDAIRQRALHDPLTGLPNRVLFLDRLEQALARLARHSMLAAVLFLDLDQFKLVNDSLGHHVGDELLTAVAPRLLEAVRASDTVARFGGDEFGILLEDVSGEHDAIEMAERIAAVFTRPFRLDGAEHFVSASIGIAVARGGEAPAALIRDADAAMYRAKERGRARYELFDELMRARAMSRLRLENDLRRALERGELRLDYQPIVSLADGRVASVEALLRWRHPERGEIEPADFIPVAEETGLFEPIGRWALERACRQAARWSVAWTDGPPPGVSVNLSTAQLARLDLPGLISSTLSSSGLEPRRLSLEITETTTPRELDALLDVLAALKAIGVRLVLDDFGTGCASLGYLTRLPVDALKIARPFVDGVGCSLQGTAITEAIVAISRALGLEVVAEGVQSERQADELRRLGCGFAQGLHFGPPTAPEHLAGAAGRGARLRAAQG